MKPTSSPPATPATPSTAPAVSEATAPATAAASTASPIAPASPGAATKPAAPVSKPPLDFNSLVARLRGTSAIGVFTKLSVKNEVDDLLDAFRGYYAGKAPPTLDDLHERYDGLVLKVVSLVQGGDAALASDISASRGAIWERLSNKESFQEI